MAATLILQYGAATGDVTFIERVQMAMLATANNLNAEAGATANHANRMALMKAVTNAPVQYAPLFAFLIAAQGIDGTSTDANIQSMISTTWNSMAGQV